MRGHQNMDYNGNNKKKVDYYLLAETVAHLDILRPRAKQIGDPTEGRYLWGF